MHTHTHTLSLTHTHTHTQRETYGDLYNQKQVKNTQNTLCERVTNTLTYHLYLAHMLAQQHHARQGATRLTGSP